MKNLSDLKRILVLGQKIEMLTMDGKKPPEKLCGVREVVKLQTNGVYFSRFKGSPVKLWFDFPKASNLEIQSPTRSEKI